MKTQLLALFLLFAVTTATSAQTFNKETENPTPSVKMKQSKASSTHANEGEYVKMLRASKAAQAKAGRDTVSRLQTSNK